MKSYEECNYSFFYSFSSKDDDKNQEWITSFHKAFEKTLDGAISPDVKEYKPSYMYKQDPIVSGNTEKKLNKKLNAAFAYVAVIDENYLQSEACDLEFRHMKQYFDSEESDGRVFIIALSKKAYTEIEKKLDGYTINPAYDFKRDELWDVNSKDAKQLSRSIVKDIRRSVEEAVNNNSIPTGQTIFTERNILKVGVLPVTRSITTQIDELFDEVKEMIQGGIKVEKLSEEAIAQTIILKPQELENYFDEFDFLLQPYCLEHPLGDELCGGGLVVKIADKLKEYIVPNDKQDKGLILWHLNELDSLKEQSEHYLPLDCLKEKAKPTSDVIKLLAQKADEDITANTDDGDVARVYIESNKIERNHWESLEEIMQEIWSELNEEKDAQSLTIAAKCIDIPTMCNKSNITDNERLDLSKADGFVVLWGEEKNPKALEDQIEFIDNETLRSKVKLPPNLPKTPPGMIAYLVPPKDKENVPAAYLWRIASFSNEDPKLGKIRPLTGNNTNLSVEQFLRQVRKRRLAKMNA